LGGGGVELGLELFIKIKRSLVMHNIYA